MLCELSDKFDCKFLIKDNNIVPTSKYDKFMFTNTQPTKDAYYTLFNKVDICIDTFPYSGTTTTCDSLLMGTPVLTLDNNKCIHQHPSGSILINSDLSTYIYQNFEDLLNKLQTFVQMIKDDHAYKENIRKKFLSGKVTNSKEYMEDYENLMFRIYKNI